MELLHGSVFSGICWSGSWSYKQSTTKGKISRCLVGGIKWFILMISFSIFLFGPYLVHPKTKNFSRFLITSNLAAHALSIKYRWKQKLIAQFVCKSRDESFKPSYSIIGQCLSNKNESATMSKSKNFLDLNKALVCRIEWVNPLSSHSL